MPVPKSLENDFSLNLQMWSLLKRDDTLSNVKKKNASLLKELGENMFAIDCFIKLW